MTVYTQLHDRQRSPHRAESGVVGPILSKDGLSSAGRDDLDDDADRLLRLALLVRGETTLTE